MGKKNEGSGDMFLNFKAFAAATGATATTLTELKVPTGLSIRGGLIFLIHMFELHTPDFTANWRNVTVAVSTRSGLATMPLLGDHGLVVMWEVRAFMSTQGMYGNDMPKVQNWLPPIPLAAPSMSVYVQSATAHSDGNGKPVNLRMGFTTAPLDAAAYTEIAETWGW